MKTTASYPLLLFVLLYSLPLQASSQQVEIAPIIVDPSTVRLKHPIDALRESIAGGRASIADIKHGLVTGKIGDITNILSALYNMRSNPQVRHLLYDLWRQERQSHTDLPWGKLEHPVVRTAVAAVMNRIAAGTIPEFLEYLRGQADSELKLVRAQVALALGMTGYPQDIDLLKRFAQGESDYVSRSAITGLGFAYQNEAKQALIDLREQYKGSERGVYAEGMLREAYQWAP